MVRVRRSREHVAVIMDGNGRWARRRGLPRAAGHLAGVDAVRRTIRAARALDLCTLTLFAFSSDNWKRPEHEVDHLLQLLGAYFQREASECAENGIAIRAIGRRDRLPRRLRQQIVRAEMMTSSASNLLVRVAIDYSARWSIHSAAQLQSASGAPPRSGHQFLRCINAAIGSPDTAGVDVLVRTGGEKRLSDFMLWEAAHARLVFFDIAWPDFQSNHLLQAVTGVSTAR